MMTPLKTTSAILAATMLTMMAPSASAVIVQDAACAPVDGLVNDVCVTVTINIFSTANSFCTSRGVTVNPGEKCYSITYDLFAQTLTRGLGLSGSGSGNHFPLNCSVPVGSLTSTCDDDVTFALSATSPHCDRVKGRASNFFFTTPEANTGLVCAS